MNSFFPPTKQLPQLNPDAAVKLQSTITSRLELLHLTLKCLLSKQTKCPVIVYRNKQQTLHECPASEELMATGKPLLQIMQLTVYLSSFSSNTLNVHNVAHFLFLLNHPQIVKQILTNVNHDVLSKSEGQ